MTLVSRDPFAREELHRETVHVPDTKTCSWCSGIRWNGKRTVPGHTAKGGTRTLFAYRTETDGGRHIEHNGLFCSKSCHDSFHHR